MNMARKRKITIDIIEGDATSIPADVLILKYAQGEYGVHGIVYLEVTRTGINPDLFCPPDGFSNFFASNDAIASKNVLVVGVKGLYEFSYPDIRRFARAAIEEVAKQKEDIQYALITLHGAGYGLDVVEAFESELAGLIDGVTGGNVPRSLRRISFVELDSRRHEILRKALERYVPKGYIEIDLAEYLREIEEDVSEKFRSVGYASAEKPHIFVAMPFKDEMEDVYEYGIQNAVREAGYLCERADLAAFTGDVVDWVKKRIKSSSLVIADLSGSNANVYLEVGYAWGSGIRTVLIVQSAEELKFDVKGQRCITYKRIKELEEKLKIELLSLKEDMPI